jgi:hypothetical protein
MPLFTIFYIQRGSDMTHDTSKEGPSVSNAGGGGGDTYTNSTPTSVTLGGIAAGSTFSAKTMQEMWDLLLYPYQAPTFSSLAITTITVLEVGAGIGGIMTFTWTTTNASNIVVGSLSILDITGSATLESSLNNTGSKTHDFTPPITKNTATFNRFQIQGQSTALVTFTRNLDVYWYWKAYYGEEGAAGPLDETAIEGLRVGGLQAGFAGTYVFQAGGYKYLCYAAVLGTATSFKNAANNLDVDMQAPYTVSVTNVNGVATNYNVHRTTYQLGGAITIIVS